MSLNTCATVPTLLPGATIPQGGLADLEAVYTSIPLLLAEGLRPMVLDQLPLAAPSIHIAISQSIALHLLLVMGLSLLAVQLMLQPQIQLLTVMRLPRELTLSLSV